MTFLSDFRQNWIFLTLLPPLPPPLHPFMTVFFLTLFSPLNLLFFFSPSLCLSAFHLKRAFTACYTFLSASMATLEIQTTFKDKITKPEWDFQWGNSCCPLPWSVQPPLPNPAFIFTDKCQESISVSQPLGSLITRQKAAIIRRRKQGGDTGARASEDEGISKLLT